MFRATEGMVLPTTMTGSYPKPNWYTQGLHGRAFKTALGDNQFREQYLDAVAAVISDQEMAGLDILTDGDSRFDLEVGGKSWFFYVLERLGGLQGNKSLSPGWSGDYSIRPGHILYEVQEAYQPPIVAEKLSAGRLDYSAIWKVAQKMTPNTVKFGSISSQSLTRMMWNEFYPTEKELILDLCDIINQELRELADSGCKLIQVEEPRHHFMAQDPATSDEDYQFFTDAFNREVNGVEAEIWLHTCWGNPAQQRLASNPSYEKAIPHLLEVDADVITFEIAGSDGKDLALFAQYETSKKIAIGVVNHTDTVVESPEKVADLIRRALEYVPAERLIISTNCGFGREGISRRIAFHKCVALVQGTNIIRRELGLPEATVRAADPLFAFSSPAANQE
ncbi:MAG: cobalamin-independent methionine synthase II family protein [Chloroflexi bacterium]|nr:cobalamin-independent methionine synthase II family protein [Chloroflexota bacterium]